MSILGLLPCPAMAQVLSKRMVTESDYHLWSTLRPEKISDEGKWVSFSKTYESETDTLFVKHTHKDINYVCPNAKSGIFGSEHSFAYLRSDTLVVLDLVKGNRRFINFVNQFDFSWDAEYLIISQKNNGDGSNLTIYDKDGKISRIVKDVITYKFDPNKKSIVYVTRQMGLNAVLRIDFKNNLNSYVIAKDLTGSVTTLTWNATALALAFYVRRNDSERDEDMLYYYHLKSKELHFIGNCKEANLSKVNASSNVRLSISDDGKRVFFGMSTTMVKKTINGKVEIWNTNDKSLYTPRTESPQDYFQSVGIWWPENNFTFPINSQDVSWIALTGDQQYALIADRLQYEPQYKWIADMDYYLVDLKSGNRKLFLDKHSGYANNLSYSPDGRYIAYYRNNDWWIYNILNETRYKLTSLVETQWDSQSADPGNEVQVWGIAGWSTDGKSLLLYDSYDIWIASINSLQCHRLTYGKEEGIKYRLDSACATNNISSNYSSITAASFDLTKSLIVKGIETATANSGYYILKLKKGIEKFTSNDCAIKNLLSSKNNKTVVYLQQTFNNSPALIFRDKQNSKNTILALSNVHQKNFQWGQSKMIHFENKKKKTLNASLFYPAGYSPEKKYPMIVYIYSTVSEAKNEYVNPSLHNVMGFNISNLTSKGYFVLLPDIAYEIGNTGISAYECVSSAVEKVLSIGLVDKKRVGLIGHSFGGYEVNFIITQTGIFATAVSGSAVSDNISHYFTINTNNNMGESWRYENQQYRMGKSFYHDKEAYFKNSPIFHADNIGTPILTWQGALDENVQPTQGKEFFLALRRLGKKNVMLVYPDDGHILSKSDNQEDLTRKIEDWFGYYLKDECPKPWMNVNL
ncbi:prolyl oligopeptidase family serine peptidase [Flavobacterium potami]|nr:prolyl oligopeptidase family serine peptidase [Flavobacterium potami]